MSTMEPEVIEGGRRMEGNSIWSVISIAGLFHEEVGRLRILGGEIYEALIFSEENGDAGIDFADSKGYEHLWLEKGIGAWGLNCVEVSEELWQGCIGALLD